MSLIDLTKTKSFSKVWLSATEANTASKPRRSTVKVTPILTEVNPERMLDVAFDVGKDKLNSVFEIGPQRYEDEFGNRSSAIRRELKGYMEQARANGFETLRVLCEPSGGYEKALVKIAHQLGCRTAYVGDEASPKFSMVVYGEPGK